MFRLTKLSQCTFGIPDFSQCVLGLAYNVNPTCYCIYVYFGCDVCSIPWGRCSLGSWLCLSWFFHPLAFQFLVEGLRCLSTCNLFLLLLCVFFYFSKYKVRRFLSGVCTGLR